MTGREWIDAYAASLGAEPPTEQEVEQVLALAGVAAHGSERIAAPVAAWIAGRAGIELGEAIRLAQEIPAAGSG